MQNSTSYSGITLKSLCYLIMTPLLLNSSFAMLGKAKAQVITPLEGPTINQISPSGFPDAENFKVDTITSCPVPTFNLLSSYGQSRDKNNPIIFPRSSDVSRRNANGFAVAAGVTIPLTGNGDACQELLEAKVKNVQQFNTRHDLILQSEILRECYKLYKLNINFEDPVFDKDGPSGGLFPCRGLAQSFTSDFEKKDSTVSDELERYQPGIEAPDTSSLIPDSGNRIFIFENDVD